jgi:hypothetical protein
MTIAAVYLSPEGVVFGADSTTTISAVGTGPAQVPLPRHYNYAQKIFQVGDGAGTLGLTMWGMADLGTLSYRTLIAQFAEVNYRQATNSLMDVAARFGQFFWQEYTSRRGPQIQRVLSLHGQAQRSPAEDQELAELFAALSGGFCLGGNLLHDRTPGAIQIDYQPTLSAPALQPLPIGARFWGVPNLIYRLFWGIDPDLLNDILQSGHWAGNPADLLGLVNRRQLIPAQALPIREAIDWVHASVYATIKTLKFSQLAPVCGGPVEVAVITTDRSFRWVRHKTLDAAIAEGGPRDG